MKIALPISFTTSLAAVALYACAPAETNSPDPEPRSGGSPADTSIMNTGGNTGGSAPAANGGNTGTGGSPGNAGDCSAAATDDLISDFEDGTGDLPPRNGRAGGWYAYNDMSAGGMQTPAPTLTASITPSMLGERRCGSSQWAMHAQGSGFTTWGAGIGSNINAPYDANQMKSLKAAYDAGAYTGIAFWAKVAQGSTPTVRVQLPNVDTDPDGGRCKDCNNHLGKTLTLNTSWQRYTIRFAEARQSPGWGESVAKFDTSKLFAVQFQFDKGQVFDLWIDDVAFTK